MSTAKPGTAIDSNGDKSNMPIMMWNVNDVRVGYDKHLAKQFGLDGKDLKDAMDVLPKLNVDQDIPYIKSKRRSHQVSPLKSPNFTSKGAASKPVGSSNMMNTFTNGFQNSFFDDAAIIGEEGLPQTSMGRNNDASKLNIFAQNSSVQPPETGQDKAKEER